MLSRPIDIQAGCSAGSLKLTSCPYGLLYHLFPLEPVPAAGLKIAQTFPAPASIVNNVHLGQKQGCSCCTSRAAYN